MSSPISIVGSPKVYTVTIAASASQSDEIELQGQINGFSIEMPTAWTSASITFLGSHSAGGTYKKIVGDTGTELTVTAATNEMIAIDTATKVQALRGFKYIKVRSGTAASPVTQAAERTLYLITK